uniref:Uncharacterized protein n=1 Tax=Pipistrellus kuhlii TaxID=59472 RepID=A0A7J7VNB6_PIPKU|nr:hypothetical protein mPipKuh1_008444 [Pipistrellus kuhlii]
MESGVSPALPSHFELGVGETPWRQLSWGAPCAATSPGEKLGVGPVPMVTRGVLTFLSTVLPNCAPSGGPQLVLVSPGKGCVCSCTLECAQRAPCARCRPGRTGGSRGCLVRGHWPQVKVPLDRDPRPVSERVAQYKAGLAASSSGSPAR